MALALIVNGKRREFEALSGEAALALVLSELGLKADRVAVEHNSEIVPRTRWEETTVHEGDKLEVVHFVGGGTRTS